MKPAAARARAAAAGAPEAVAGIKDDASFLDPREVRRMVDSGDLVLKSEDGEDGAPALLDDWESIGRAGGGVDFLLSKYAFHDASGAPIDLNDAQRHKLLVKLVESRRMRGWQERLAREMEAPDGGSGRENQTRRQLPGSSHGDLRRSSWRGRKWQKTWLHTDKSY